MTSPDFEAAQQRVLARYQRQQSEAQSRLEAQRTSSASTALSRLPYPLNYLGREGVGIWNNVRGREGTRPQFRVGQVDAELLDEELLGLLKGQVGEGLKFLGSHLRDDWSSEILLGLRALLFKFTIWDHNASYGAALQNLRYTDARHKGSAPLVPSKWQKVLYGLFTVGGRYTWSRWEDWLAHQEGGYEEVPPNVLRLLRLSSIASTTHSILAFGSFLVFLFNGRYRTLLDRILRLKLAPPVSQVSREVSFEYLNRQLVWHAFTEFLLFLLPLVGISRWRRWLSRLWRKTKALIQSNGTTGEEESSSRGELGFLPERTCAICYKDLNPSASSESEIMAATARTGGFIGSAQTDITNPYETIPCSCVYCFVCIATRLEAEDDTGWTCLRCGELVKGCRPWAGDVLEVTLGPTAKKQDSLETGEKPSGRGILADEKVFEDYQELVPRQENQDATSSLANEALEYEEWARTPSGAEEVR